MTEEEIEKVARAAIEHSRQIADEQDERYPSPGMVEAIVRFTITALDQYREGKEPYVGSPCRQAIMDDQRRLMGTKAPESDQEMNVRNWDQRNWLSWVPAFGYSGLGQQPKPYDHEEVWVRDYRNPQEEPRRVRVKDLPPWVNVAYWLWSPILASDN